MVVVGRGEGLHFSFCACIWSTVDRAPAYRAPGMKSVVKGADGAIGAVTVEAGNHGLAVAQRVGQIPEPFASDHQRRGRIQEEEGDEVKQLSA